MDKSEYDTGMKQVEKLLNKEKYSDALVILKGLLDKTAEENEYKADILSKISEAYYGKEGVKTGNAISNLIESLKIRANLEQPEILALEMMNLAYLQDEEIYYPRKRRIQKRPLRYMLKLWLSLKRRRSGRFIMKLA
ncbi:MAG: hypothetical protein M1498_01615 [Candidatus Thermoplasmatota archaeon]|nr:hypothetical protein [Candidatus Thermoplasmatota archaeon]